MKSRAAKESPTERKRTRLASVGRILLCVPIIIALCLLFIVGGAALYFTPKRIEAIVKPQVERQTGGRFDFSLARFNPLQGITLRNITLTLDSAQNRLPIRLFTAREILFEYNLKHLLRRRLTIQKIHIEDPELHLSLAMGSQEQLAGDQADTMEASLPLDVQLKLLRLTNASILVETRDSTSLQRIFVREINLFLDDLSALRGQILQPDHDLRGALSISLSGSPFCYEQLTSVDSMAVCGRLDASLKLLISRLSRIDLQGTIRLDQTTIDLNNERLLDSRGKSLPLSVMTRMRLDFYRQRLEIDSLALAVQDVSWFSLSMVVDSLLSMPTLKGYLLHGAVPLQQLVDIASLTLPQGNIPDLFLHNSAAVVAIDSLTFSGKFGEEQAAVDWAAFLSLKDAGVTADGGNFFLGGLNLSAVMRGAVREQTIEHADLQLSAVYDSASVTLPELTPLYTGPLTLAAAMSIGRDGFPADLEAKLTVRNLLGANAAASLRLRTPKELSRAHGNAVIRLDGFDLSQLPGAQWAGNVSAEADVEIRSLDSLRFDARVTTDTLTAIQEGQLYVVAPMTVKSTARGAFHLDDNRLEVRALDFSLDPFLRAQLRADLSLVDSSAVLHNFSAAMDHAALYEKLPNALKEQIPGAGLSGRTSFEASGRFKLSADMLPSEFEVKAALQSRADLSLPAQGVKIKDFSAEGELVADSRRGGFMQFAVSLDTTRFLLPNPLLFRDNRLLIRLSVPNLSTISLDTGYVSIPDLHTLGAVSGRIENLTTHPFLSLKASLRQSAEDTLIFAPEVFFKGINEIDLNIRADSSHAVLNASVRTKDLSVYMPNDIRIDRLNADLAFLQEFDFVNPSRLGRSPAVVRTPSDGLVDYLLYRNYYRSYPNKSRLSIKRIQIGPYQVENVLSDIFLGNGRLEIPYFALDAYGGNIAGQFSLAAGEKDPLDASYKLTAHISSINSSLLLPSAASEKSNITAHAELRGRGLDINKGIDLDGYFNISEIESKVADNLLRSLDPEGKDSGIRSTRLLINRGFKPKLFRFEIRHGFCYPAVYFQQPWYFPVRLIGGGIELSRIPIVTLLKLNPNLARSFK